MTLYAYGDRTPQLPGDGDFWLAPGAHVIGDVALASGTSIWFGAALRGDNERISVGPGSNVQENAVLHTDMGYPLEIGADCTIGHTAILHGCQLGDGVLIGMGATVLNSAVIGDGCLIGACALITEGKEIPPGSLVMGSPGRVVKPLTPDAIEGLRASAAHYRDRMRAFRRDLRPL
ncbi:MAG: gamma carbonic anhydrase family protein [Pseudomonadota bacterium]